MSAFQGTAELFVFVCSFLARLAVVGACQSSDQKASLVPPFAHKGGHSAGEKHAMQLLQLLTPPWQPGLMEQRCPYCKCQLPLILVT